MTYVVASCRADHQDVAGEGLIRRKVGRSAQVSLSALAESHMDIRISEELWATAMAPEGVLERWRVMDGAPVRRGDTIAEVRIEECLHDIVAPGDGRIVRLLADGALIEPGTIIARLEVLRRSAD